MGSRTACALFVSVLVGAASGVVSAPAFGRRSPVFAAPGSFSCKPATRANRLTPPPPIWAQSGNAPSGDETATANATTPLCPSGKVPAPIAHGRAVADVTRRTGGGSVVASEGNKIPQDDELVSMSPSLGGELCRKGGCYWYAFNEVNKTAIGMEYQTDVAEPHVSSFAGAHSIDQLALGGGTNGRQYTIEAGWDVDLGQFKSPIPHFFIFTNNDAYSREPEECKEGKSEHESYDCNFVPLEGAKIAPGEAIEPGLFKYKFGVKYVAGDWWIWAGTQWIGYVPETFWEGHFTQGTLEANYGEVFDSESDPTSQMGNGQAGASSGATSMTQSVVLINENVAETTGYHGRETNETLYSIGDIVAGRIWHFGGSGVPDPPPSVFTEPATEDTSTSAVLHGAVDPNGGDTRYYFEYGTTTKYGQVVPAELTDIGSGVKLCACKQRGFGADARD